MSKKFITNQEKLLSDLVNNYLKDSDNLYSRNQNRPGDLLALRAHLEQSSDS